MKVILHNLNLFDVAEADTIALPVDGLRPGLEGSVAHQLLKRVGADSLADVYRTVPQYPFNGKAHWSPLDDYPEVHFDWLCALGTGIRTSSGMGRGTGGPTQKDLARASLRHMFAQAVAGDVGSRIACPILSGGGRISDIDAAMLMLDEADRFGHPLELHIAERREGVYRQLRPIIG